MAKVKKVKYAKKNLKNYSSTFKQDIEMLNYFQNEFMYRHTHYWNILIKFFLLTIIITILPVTSEVLGVVLDNIPQKSLLIFPALGLIVAIFSSFILLDEAKKLQAVNEAKYRINRQNMAKKYHYAHYNDKVGKNITSREKENERKKWLSFRMIWIMLGTELLIIIGVFFILVSG